MAWLCAFRGRIKMKKEETWYDVLKMGLLALLCIFIVYFLITYGHGLFGIWNN